MKKSAYADEQIVGFLREGEKTKLAIAEFCRSKGFNKTTFYGIYAIIKQFV